MLGYAHIVTCAQVHETNTIPCQMIMCFSRFQGDSTLKVNGRIVLLLPGVLQLGCEFDET